MGGRHACACRYADLSFRVRRRAWRTCSMGGGCGVGGGTGGPNGAPCLHHAHRTEGRRIADEPLIVHRRRGVDVIVRSVLAADRHPVEILRVFSSTLLAVCSHGYGNQHMSWLLEHSFHRSSDASPPSCGALRTPLQSCHCCAAISHGGVSVETSGGAGSRREVGGRSIDRSIDRLIDRAVPVYNAYMDLRIVARHL